MAYPFTGSRHCFPILLKFFNSTKQTIRWDTEREFRKEPKYINPCPAEPGCTMLSQAVQIQISWLLQKPTDLDLHCLLFSMWIYINNLDQVIWLADKKKWAWHLNLFSMTSVKNIPGLYGHKMCGHTVLNLHSKALLSYLMSWKVIYKVMMMIW